MNAPDSSSSGMDLRFISMPPVVLTPYRTPSRWILSVTANHLEEAIGLLGE